MAQSPEQLHTYSIEEISALAQKLYARQHDLEVQNEGLRHALERITTSQDKYTELYHRGLVGYLTLDRISKTLTEV